MSAVYGVIRKLGATSKYKGYYYVVDAVDGVDLYFLAMTG